MAVGTRGTASRFVRRSERVLKASAGHGRAQAAVTRPPAGCAGSTPARRIAIAEWTGGRRQHGLICRSTPVRIRPPQLAAEYAKAVKRPGREPGDRLWVRLPPRLPVLASRASDGLGKRIKSDFMQRNRPAGGAFCLAANDWLYAFRARVLTTAVSTTVSSTVRAPGH